MVQRVSDHLKSCPQFNQSMLIGIYGLWGPAINKQMD